jgi:hypothetical protein
MKVKVLVKVDREAALAAIYALDMLEVALRTKKPKWRKELKRSYKHARRGLIRAIGYVAETNSVAAQ